MVEPFEPRAVKTGKPFNSPTCFNDPASSVRGRAALYHRSFWNSTKMPFDASTLGGWALREGRTLPGRPVEVFGAFADSRDRANKSDAYVPAGGSSTGCEETTGGPAACNGRGVGDTGDISTGSDGTVLPVVPTRSPFRRRSYGCIIPPAIGT